MYANANGELFYQMDSQGVVTVDKRFEFAAQITSIGKSSGLIVICSYSHSYTFDLVNYNQLREVIDLILTKNAYCITILG